MRPPLSILTAILLLCSCNEAREHTAGAINPRDSVSMMKSYGINTLISDSGLIKYRLVAESWEVNQARDPSRWIFLDGLFLEQFDEKFHVEAWIQGDTAYYYDKLKLWELHGRVRVRNVEGLRFASEELFWDQNRHEMYSNKFSRLITPDRDMQGTYFISNEGMTQYTIDNSKGSFVKSKVVDSEGDTILAAPDTVKAKVRQPTAPSQRKPVGMAQAPGGPE